MRFTGSILLWLVASTTPGLVIANLAAEVLRGLLERQHGVKHGMLVFMLGKARSPLQQKKEMSQEQQQPAGGAGAGALGLLQAPLHTSPGPAQCPVQANKVRTVCIC